jgi:peptide/nickel transport system substrate-binding protein
MLYYPLINDYYAYDPADDPNFDDRINNAIGSNATHAWVSLETDFPETTFLQIMSQSWASIVNKAWAVAKGDFDGNWAAGWATIYNTWHNPDESFIEGDMMGTGPYKFDYWVQGTAYSVVRNTDYWDDETAKPGEGALVSANGKERLPGSISRVTWNLITAWTTRQLRFLAGDVDYTAVPRQYRDQVLGVSVGGAPIRCFYPIEPQLAVDAEFFTFDINTASPYLGVPGGLPRGTFSQLGIPPDIFNDIHVRLGFAAAFDYNTFLTSAYLGEAVQPSDPIIVGLSYDNPAAKKPVFNMATAATELTAAWGGALWAGGMKLTLLFNEGNVARETASNMLANNIMSLNPKFHVEVQQVAWGSTYLPQMVAGMLPLFSIGWLVDYPDPDNFAFPFMHTYGTFSAWQRYSNARVDTLIENGALMPEDTAPYSGQLDVADPRPLFNNPGGMPPDTRWPRRSIYYELQALYVEDSPGFTLDQAKGRGFQQAWTRGWYYNPVYPGAYFYHRWKAKTHFGDANNDQAVGVLDSATVSGSWTKPSPTSTLGPVGYRTQADLTGGTGGTTGDASGLVVGIPDGKVSVVDSALVSAYWDGPPKGPSHTF